MSGRSSDSERLRYLGAAVAVIAVIGYVSLGWRFGENGGVLLALAVGFLLVWTGLELYRGLS